MTTGEHMPEMKAEPRQRIREGWDIIWLMLKEAFAGILPGKNKKFFEERLKAFDDKNVEIIRQFLASVRWTFLLFGLFLLLDKFGLLERFEVEGYYILSQHLSQGGGLKDCPIRIIDIKELNPSGEGITHRPELRSFIYNVLKDRNSLPRAIGIDVDFSPDSNGMIDSNDMEFLHFCWKEEHDTNVPIYLGVARAAPYGKKVWLGMATFDKRLPDVDFSTLAAYIGVPDDKKHLFASLRPNGHEELISMGMALGRSYHNPPSILERHGFQNVSTQDIIKGFSVTQFLVDYTWVDVLENSSPRSLADVSGLSREAQKHRQELKDKIVLLGNCEPTIDDVFTLPNERDSVPGVYLHASAAATLATKPLLEINQGIRRGLDLGLSLGLLIVITLLRLNGLGSYNLMENPLPWWVAGVIVFGVAVFLVWYRVLWLDFLVVVCALFAHPMTHHLKRRSSPAHSGEKI